jgi:hypothetical protein
LIAHALDATPLPVSGGLCEKPGFTKGVKMIRSMTAFARQEARGTWGNLVWELRSVNHRFLEVSVRLPEEMRSIEP